jgi:hypothetical protein
MCGKGLSQTTQQTAMPSLAGMMAYNQAMSRVGAATSKPFQRYSEDPTAYVASLTPVQQQAISNVAAMQGMTQPYYQTAGGLMGAAAGLTGAGAGGVGRLTGAQIAEYMSPYMSQVVDPVRAAIQQQSGQQLARQQAEAIRGGAFGGERAGLQRSQLLGQQALGLGQALSPLYQTGYGQALQTALGQQNVEAANLQRLLGAGAQMGQLGTSTGALGTAAQQAALQQAQAQLQAATLQQQTETAQKQAMYGEFQKERMYPLQVAQLYAQTAGALGPLMGSTSMGYQQLPFFGAVATGGAIKGYEEGLGAARMGGAVREGGDFARGGYADGGSPDFAYLVESHRAGIMPKVEDVAFPTGEFRTSEAPKMGAMPERQAGLIGSAVKYAISDPESAMKKAKGLYTGYGEVKDWLEKSGYLPGKAEGGDVEDDAMNKLLSAPIQTSKPMQAPQPQQKEGSGLLGSLAKMGASAAANYFLPGSGAVVSGGLSALGLADGGRAGYADRGAVKEDEDIFERGIIPAESAGRQLTREGHPLLSPKGATGIAQIMPGTAPEAAKLAGLPMDMERLKYDEGYNRALGRAYFGEQLRQFGTPELAAAAYNAGPGRVRQALARAEREGGDVMSYLPAETRAYVPTVMGKAGLGGGNIDRSLAGIPKGDPRREITASAAQPTVGGIVPVKQEGAEPTDWRQVVLPVLSGLGAMAGSRSKYLGSALLEGLGAGAKSYMDVGRQIEEQKKLGEEVGTQRETTGLVREEAGKTAAGTLREVLESGKLGIQQFGPADAPFYIVTLEDGTRMPLEQWMEKGGNLIGGSVAADVARRLSAGKTGATYQQPSPPAAAAVETAKDISAVPEGKTIPTKEAEGVPAPKTVAPKQPPLTKPMEAPTMTPGVVYDDESRKQAQENKKIKFSSDPSLVRTAEEARKIYGPKTISGAQTARENTPYLNELSETLSKAYKGKGLATPGYGAAVRSQAIKAADTIYRALGGEGSLSNLPEAADVTGKITSLLGRESAASAGQESYAALNAIREAIPNLEMDPRAGAKLAAELMVLRKRAIDREEHMKAWSRDSGGVLLDAASNFSEKNPDAKYQVAQKVISDMMIRHPDAFERIMSGTVPRESIERQLRAQYGSGIPEGISEFFPSLQTSRRKTP